MGDTTDRSVLTKLLIKGPKPKMISCGRDHVVLVNEAGKVFTWGKGMKQRLGVDTPLDRLKPLVLDLDDNFIVFASAGDSHTLLLNDKNQIISFGWNKYGQVINFLKHFLFIFFIFY